MCKYLFLFLFLLLSVPAHAGPNYTVYANGTLADVGTPAKKKFRQTGKKVFLESDEGQVANIKVPTPDFDRLSAAEKQSILTRIKYKEIK